MDIQKILDYQNLDSELFKIEKQIRDDDDKKRANVMHENMKNAQAKSIKLEEKAGSLLNEIDKVKKQLKIQNDKMEEFMSKDLKSLSKDELDKLEGLKNKLNQNLSILEKNLTSLAESVNSVLADFNKTIKVFNSSKEEFAKCKKNYDDKVQNIEKDKVEIEKKLKSLEKNIDSKLLEAYKKRRGENIFPIVVKLKGNSCGGCHIELPYANITKLDSEGILICEHCRRIIYKGND